MVYNAKHVRLEVVSFVRKCGISCNSMLEHAKSLNATYHAAGLHCSHLYSQELLNNFLLIRCVYIVLIFIVKAAE